MRSKPSRQHFCNNLRNGMDEANRPKVSNVLGALFFGYESNICGVEPMEVVGVEARELVDNGHYIMLNNIPTSLEESPGKAIRARGLVTMGSINRRFDLFHGERHIKIGEVTCGGWDVRPIEVGGARGGLFNYSLEVVLNDLSFLVVIRDPPIVIL